MKRYLFLLLIPTLALAQFWAGGTTKRIDTIENESQLDILLNPTDKVDIGYFTGEKALQSTIDGELEESSITNSELANLSGSTENIQAGLDSKQPLLSGTNGDLFFWNSGLANLGIGSTDQVLTVSALGFPIWADPAISTTLTTKGQIQGFSTVNANIGPCTDNQILVYDNLEATGWRCAELPSTSPTTNQGDLIVRGLSEDERLPPGLEGQLLTIVGGLPAYADAPISLPDQTGNEGKFLTTDGSVSSWTDSLQGRLNPLTDWELVTLTTNNVGSVSGQSIYKRQVGDSWEYKGEIIFSGALTTNFQLTLDEIPSNSMPERIEGHAVYDDNGGNQNSGNVYILKNSTTTTFRFPRLDGTNNNWFILGSTFPQTIDPGDRIRFSFTFKADNITSGLNGVVRNETLVQARFGSTTDQNIPNNVSTTISLNSQVYDTQNIIDLANNKIIIPKDGVYTFHPLIILRNTVSTQPPANSRCFSGLTVIAGPNTGQGGSFGGFRVGTPPNTLWAYNCGNQSFEGEFSAGDEIQFTVSHNFGNNVEIVANNYVSLSEQPSSYVITGTFEGINSDQSSQVSATQTVAQSIGNATVTKIIFDTEAKDTNNEFDPVTGEFTAKSRKRLLIDSSIWMENNFDGLCFLRIIKNGSIERTGNVYTDTRDRVNCDISAQVDVIENDVIYVEVFMADLGSLGRNTEPNSNNIYLDIAEMPDFESVVANLSNQTIKCQTKFLSADVIANSSDVTDLRFDNLTIGNRYRVKVKPKTETSSSSAHNFGYAGIANFGFRIGDTPTNSIIQNHYKENDFTATSTSLLFSTANMATSRRLLGNGNEFETHVTLCELPGNYIETTEW